LQFIRQPEIDRADTRLLIAVQDNLVELGGSGYTFLDDVDVLDVVGDPTAYPRLKNPRYFVCTNGQRDLCCARFGLPTYRTLREEVGDRVWQATHLGGHRFAPNVLTLPDGVLYGRVNVDDVADFLAATESGEVAFRHLRGRSRYSAPVQAAEAALGRPGLELQHVDNGNPEVTVTFSAGDELLKIAVRQGKEPLSVVKSCGDEAEPVYPYYAV
jgi:(2Fe-2S) ferredoxin